jgi:hypothetical protein
MIDYLTHYYNSDTGPFQSLSALSDEEALKIMERLCDDTPYGERFKQPVQYLENRKATERWVREAFMAKGGLPQATYPIPMVLGSSKWLDAAAPEREKHREIRIPLSLFAESEVSFTYPDSMISRWFGLEKPAAYYQAEFHGKVFTCSEILSIVDQKGLPEEAWENKLPPNLAPYIEAQVWNHDRLHEFIKAKRPNPTSS